MVGVSLIVITSSIMLNFIEMKSTHRRLVLILLGIFIGWFVKF